MSVVNAETGMATEDGFFSLMNQGGSFDTEANRDGRQKLFAPAVFRIVDRNHDGTIDFSEFLVAVCVRVASGNGSDLS